MGMKKTKTQKKARNNIIKTKNLRNIISFGQQQEQTKEQQIIPFRKKNKNKKPSKQICRKKHRFFRLPIRVVNLIIMLLMMHYSSYVLYDMKNENKKGKK